MTVLTKVQRDTFIKFKERFPTRGLPLAKRMYPEEFADVTSHDWSRLVHELGYSRSGDKRAKITSRVSRILQSRVQYISLLRIALERGVTLKRRLMNAPRRALLAMNGVKVPQVSSMAIWKHGISCLRRAGTAI